MSTKTISAGRMVRHIQRIRMAMEWIERSRATDSTNEFRDRAAQYAQDWLGEVSDELLEASLADVAVETRDAAA